MKSINITKSRLSYDWLVTMNLNITNTGRENSNGSV